MSIHFIKEIINIAIKAWDIALQNFNTNLSVEIKENQTPVTQIDKDIDEYIKKEIAKLYPNDQIITEESRQIPNKEKPLWLVDPLDGTKDFINWLSTFSIIIWRATPYNWADFWLIYFPITKELLYSTWSSIYHSLGWKLQQTHFELGEKIFYKQSMFKYETTKKYIDSIHADKKIEVRPSGFAMAEFLKRKWKVLALWWWYTYELCAFDWLIKSIGWIVVDQSWNQLDYFTNENKITWWIYIWNPKE